MAKDYFNVLKKKAENKGVKLSTLIIVMGSVSEEVVRKVSTDVMVIH
ncbi:hypothetical protein IPdc08_01216 [archaeon]|nr:hypothetical protein IPdc08_01216 [archaeon]